MCIKQASFEIDDPCVSKDLLVVGDMAQLPPRCNHFVESSNNVCNNSYSNISIFWRSSNHFTLTTLIRHAKNPKYLEFKNIIQV
jgi:hypothetical protein